MSNRSIYKYDDMKRGEHMAVRENCGWYLWTHHLIEVSGADAAAFLEYVCPAKIASLAVGRDRYTMILDQKAEIIDDVVVMRLGEDLFWVSTLFAMKTIPWFQENKGAFDVAFADVSKQYAMFAIQGPNATALVNAIVDTTVDDLRFFQIADNTIGDTAVKVNRAGFTGEKCGYELYVPDDQYEMVDAKLHAEGDKIGAREVTEFQVMAWTLPTEAGFYYMRDLIHTNPYEVGLTKGIDFDKEFVGKKTLARLAKRAPKHEMVGFTLEEADVRINGANLGGPGAVVMAGGEEVGRVRKLTYSYVLDKPIGYILIEAGAAKIGDRVTINGYEATICEKKFI